MTKPTKWLMRPEKTQINLGFRSVWSVFAVHVKKPGPLTTHRAHSEDWSNWVDAQADLSLRRAHMSFCWFCHDAVQFNVDVFGVSGNLWNIGKRGQIDMSLHPKFRFACKISHETVCENK